MKKIRIGLASSDFVEASDIVPLIVRVVCDSDLSLMTGYNVVFDLGVDNDTGTDAYIDFVFGDAVDIDAICTKIRHSIGRDDVVESATYLAEVIGKE